MMDANLNFIVKKVDSLMTLSTIMKFITKMKKIPLKIYVMKNEPRKRGDNTVSPRITKYKSIQNI